MSDQYPLDEIFKLGFQTKAQFDKALLTLSSAAIGVIVAFTKTKPFPEKHILALWIFLLTIFLTLLGILLLYYLFNAAHITFSSTDSNKKMGRLKRVQMLDDWQEKIMIASGLSFLIGMIFTVLGFIY